MQDRIMPRPVGRPPKPRPRKKETNKSVERPPAAAPAPAPDAGIAGTELDGRVPSREAPPLGGKLVENIRSLAFATAVFAGGKNSAFGAERLTFEQFRSLMWRRELRQQIPSSTFKHIWQLACDINSKTIDLDSFFVWTHRIARKQVAGHTAGGIESVFKRYDRAAASTLTTAGADSGESADDIDNKGGDGKGIDGEGEAEDEGEDGEAMFKDGQDGDCLIDPFEFYRLAEDMDFAESADEIFRVLDNDGSGSLSYQELGLHHSRKPPSNILCRTFLTALVFDGHKAAGRLGPTASAATGASAGVPAAANGTESAPSAAKHSMSTSLAKPPPPQLLDISTLNLANTVSSADGLRAMLVSWLRTQGASCADLYEFLAGERARRQLALGVQRIRWSMSRSEFNFGFVRTLSYYGPSHILDDVFAQCDSMHGGDGRIGFSEFFLWLQGALERIPRARAMTFHAEGEHVFSRLLAIPKWTAAILCAELRRLLEQNGISLRDLFRSIDGASDSKELLGSTFLSKRQFVAMWKQLVGEQSMWEDAGARSAALGVFKELSPCGHIIDLASLEAWVSTGGKTDEELDEDEYDHDQEEEEEHPQGSGGSIQKTLESAGDADGSDGSGHLRESRTSEVGDKVTGSKVIEGLAIGSRLSLAGADTPMTVIEDDKRHKMSALDSSDSGESDHVLVEPLGWNVLLNSFSPLNLHTNLSPRPPTSPFKSTSRTALLRDQRPAPEFRPRLSHSASAAGLLTANRSAASSQRSLHLPSSSSLSYIHCSSSGIHQFDIRLTKKGGGLYGEPEVKPTVLDQAERLRRSSSSMGSLAIPLSMIEDLETKKKQTGEEEQEKKARPSTALANATKARHRNAHVPLTGLHRVTRLAEEEMLMAIEVTMLSKRRSELNAQRRRHADLWREQSCASSDLRGGSWGRGPPYVKAPAARLNRTAWGGPKLLNFGYEDGSDCEMRTSPKDVFSRLYSEETLGSHARCYGRHSSWR